MKKLLFLLGIVLLDCVSFVFATDLNTGLRNHYVLETDGTDSLGAMHLGPYGSPAHSTDYGINGAGFKSTDAGNTYYNNASINSPEEIRTINFWMNLSDSNNEVFAIGTNGNNLFWLQIISNVFRVKYYDNGGYIYDVGNTGGALTLDVWYMFTATMTATNTSLYVNGKYNNSVSSSQLLESDLAYFGFPRYYDQYGVNVYMDEVGIWNVTLNAAQIADLYTRFYPYAPPPSLGDNITVWLNSPANNIVNDTGTNIIFNYNVSSQSADIANCSVWLNESGWQIKESVFSGITNNSANEIAINLSDGDWLWNVECCDFGDNCSFTSRGYVPANRTLTIDTTDPTITSNIENNNTYWTNNLYLQINITEVNPKNLTIIDSCNWSLTNTSMTLNPYNFEINLTNTSLCGLGTKETNVTVCDDAGHCINRSYSWENMGLLNISAFYSIDDTIINNFSVYINNTFIGNAINGSLLASNLTGDINITINSPLYAITSEIYEITKTIDAHNISVYGTNSISINIIDEILNTPIYSNISIRFTGAGITWINITNSSVFYIEDLNATNYTLQFYSTDYATRTYMITVGNRTTQNLDAYMISDEFSTIFTIADKDTTSLLSDVSFGAYKQSGAGWVLISSTLSDITGKVKFYYDPIGSYQFYLTKTDYENLIFYLNPIIFESYNLQMEKSILLNYSFNLDNIAIVYGPQTFNNTQVTNFTFLINSPYGSLISYGVNLTYPGGSNYVSGSNAIGGSLTTLINISNATVFDVVHLDYFYTTTIAGRRNFSDNFPITFPDGTGTSTFVANRNKTYGMGIFERILIATLIAIFIVGVGSFVGQPLAGFALNLFIQAYLTYIGFIPIWITLPSLLLGMMILIWKSGGT